MGLKGLTLEGGGARGAFQIGAVKAFLESGYTFDGVTGTSIGALNGAMIAQGDIGLAEEMWKSMEMSVLFPANDGLINRIKSGDFSQSTVREIMGAVANLFGSRGVDTDKIRAILDGRIDEEKLRKSGVDFGLVTVSVADLEAVTLFKERIPKGKLTDYLIASAMLPVFREDKDVGVKGARKFVDGSYFDSCPYNMLIGKGYDEIVVIRIFGFGVVHKPLRDDVKLTFVCPSEKLSSILDFTADNIEYLIKMGYYDAMRVIRNCAGTMYCIQRQEEAFYEKLLYLMDEDAINEISEVLNVPELTAKRRLHEYIVPIIAQSLSLDETFDLQDFCVTVLESHALRCGIDRFSFYSFGELARLAAEADMTDKAKDFSEVRQAYRLEYDEERRERFRLPQICLSSSYEYRTPDREKVAYAIEMLVREFHRIISYD